MKGILYYLGYKRGTPILGHTQIGSSTRSCEPDCALTPHCPEVKILQLSVWSPCKQPPGTPKTGRTTEPLNPKAPKRPFWCPGGISIEVFGLDAGSAAATGDGAICVEAPASSKGWGEARTWEFDGLRMIFVGFRIQGLGFRA